MVSSFNACSPSRFVEYGFNFRAKTTHLALAYDESINRLSSGFVRQLLLRKLNNKKNLRSVRVRLKIKMPTNRYFIDVVFTIRILI